MRNLESRHPTEEQLLRLSDGELPTAEARRIRRHIEECWQCRSEFDVLQKVIGRSVRYHKNVLGPSLPPPPLPWFDIYRRLDQIEASSRPSIPGRLFRLLAAPARNPRAWATAIAALVILAGLFTRFRQPVRVEAAELLQKAVAAAKASPATPRRIQIRTRTHRLTRVVGDHAAASAKARRISRAAEEVSMEKLFKVARYDWEDPLSARSFQAWREQLPEKRDEVVARIDRDFPARNCYEIRTVTPAGELAEASLTLRMQDLHPVETRLKFRDDEWVEISELSAEAAPAPEPLVAMSAPPRERELISAPPGAAVELATPEDELRVFAALRSLGADLGDPIEVTRDGSRVLVTGVGVDAGRREQIEVALRGMPHVAFRFAEPGSAALTAPEAEGHISVRGPERHLETPLEKAFGGRAELDRIAPEVLDRFDALMSRVHALRRLAERFPPGIEADLDATGYQLLADLRRQHAAAIHQSVAVIEEVLSPALASSGGPRPAALGAPASWQLATEALFRTARRTDRLLAAAMGGSITDISPATAASQLGPALVELRLRAEAYADGVSSDR